VRAGPTSVRPRHGLRAGPTIGPPAAWPRPAGAMARRSGVDRDRTGDIQIFSLALSQLSYHPGEQARDIQAVFERNVRPGPPHEGRLKPPRMVLGVLADGARVTQLRDYLGSIQGRPVAALADWEGDIEGRNMLLRLGDRLARANNDALSAVTGLPAQFKDNWKLLANAEQRSLLLRSLVDESLLTPRRQKAVFSILLWGSLAVWVAVGLVLFFVNRPALGTYQSVYSLFFYSLATSIFLPTPFEILLRNAVGHLGIVWTVLVAAVAKTVGAWIVLLLGAKANEGLETMLEKRALLRRIFHAMERFAQKYGYFAVFVLFAIPFMSDTAPLFVLAVLKMRKSIFLAVTFLAIVVRSVLYIYAGTALASLF
jgi:membrane protein DedA with SNARE-associated domain